MKTIHWKSHLSAIMVISSLGIIIYSNTFNCSLHFDDSVYITNNIAIRSIHQLLGHWTFYPCRFITFLSLTLNYHFNGLHVLGYHLFNLAVHLLSACCVWWLVLLTLATPAMKQDKITRHADLIALLAGLVFVSHPLQTEAVTYIWQRTASMAALFYLASLCFYIKSRLLQTENSQIFYVLSLIMAVIAMFTKENTITLPLMILLYEFSFISRLSGPAHIPNYFAWHQQPFNREATGPISLRSPGSPLLRSPDNIYAWRYLLPFLLTLLIIPLTILLTKDPQFQAIQDFVKEPNGTSPWHYLLTQFRVIVTYIRLLFLPFNQNIDYDYPIAKSLFEPPTLICSLFLAGIFYAAVRLFAKYRLLSFSIFWFFLTLSVESSFFPLKNVIFEHRLYLPMAGYSLFLVGGMYYLLGKKAIKTMVIIMMVIISFNSILTYQRNKIWKDEMTLWNDAIRKSPHKARPFYNRGFAYYQQGSIAQAISDYNRAIVLSPKPADAVGAYIGLGLCHAGQDNFTQAISDYKKALALNPKPVDASGAYLGLGLCHVGQGHFAQAVVDYKKAIAIDPDMADEYYNLGLAHYKLGDFPQSILDYTKAIEIDPQYANAYINRGISYDQKGVLAKALSDYNQAIAINPDVTEAFYNRGFLYHQEGDLPQALSDYNKAIEINPDYIEAHLNRGSIYLSQGDFIQALSDYNKVIEINPDNAAAYYNRGCIYNQQGNLPQAMSDYNKAININPGYIEAYNNRAVVYYLLKKYGMAWEDVQKVKRSGGSINPRFLKALKEISGQY